MKKLGLAGTFAHAWIDSKLTPLVIAGSLLLALLIVIGYRLAGCENAPRKD